MKKLVTSIGEELRGCGLSVRNLRSSGHDHIFSKDDAILGWTTKRDDVESLSFGALPNQPNKSTRYNTALGIALSDIGYKVKMVSSCHDYIEAEGEYVAYTTRTERKETLTVLSPDCKGCGAKDRPGLAKLLKISQIIQSQ